MAKTKKSSKSKKSEAPVDTFQRYTETVEEMLNEVTIQDIVVPSTSSDMKLAKQLTGTPVIFGENHQAALERLVSEGIAADFGDEGHARGFKWRGKVLKR